VAVVEIDRDHCATCYADGVMMATGCTFGKDNIRNQESEFIQFRKQGVPASKIAPELIEPAMDFILEESTENLFNIGPVQEIKGTPGRAHDFNTIICAECGEVAVERYARVKNGKVVCMPCAV